MRSLKIGLLLGFRQIQRASLWTTGLIIFVMALTFLNLIAVSGILVGLISGSEQAFQESVIGDITITPKVEEDFILQTSAIESLLTSHPAIKAFSVRFDSSGVIEADREEHQSLSGEKNVVSARLVGINPTAESQTTNLNDLVVEGEYFSPQQSGQILIGSLLLERYADDFPDISDSLADVQVGDDVRITIEGATRTFTVKGVIDAKVGELTNGIFLPAQELRRLDSRLEPNANRIAVRLHNPENAVAVATQLKSTPAGEYAQIQTFSEALPKFLIDIKNTFNILGIFIGAIGIVVASITIFIIIFINALARRRQIGILKGIGIDRRAIEIAYVLQAGFYVLVGSGIGVAITYIGLAPYFARNPIDFPFSDGILLVEPAGTAIRFVIVFIVTLCAGFIPAWLIARQNTLNAILGRK